MWFEASTKFVSCFGTCWYDLTGSRGAWVYFGSLVERLVKLRNLEFEYGQYRANLFLVFWVREQVCSMFYDWNSYMVCVREVPDEFRGGFGSFRRSLGLLVSGVALFIRNCEHCSLEFTVHSQMKYFCPQMRTWAEDLRIETWSFFHFRFGFWSSVFGRFWGVLHDFDLGKYSISESDYISWFHGYFHQLLVNQLEENEIFGKIFQKRKN